MIIPGEIFAPPPELNISGWADVYREIPPEAASEPGRWHTDRAPYQREMMNAINSPSTERVVMMTAAQIGKTEILLNVIGFFISQDPSPILVIHPTLQMGEAFSKDRLSTMLRDCTCLHGLVKDPRSRDSGNTLLHKTFPGGHITIAGANSPASLASRPVRILLCDEVDRYPVSAGQEGDPVALAMKRTQNFWNRKIILVSTPTLSGASRIETEYNQSTRGEWMLPCPVCGEYNALDWERVIYRDRREPVMSCVSCGQEAGESLWKSQSPKGIWRDERESVIRGFHMNALASPWVSWSDIVSQYQQAYTGGRERLKVWRNTVLGLPFVSVSDTVEVETAQERCEEYGCEIPDGVLILTAGVDTQDDRLEYEILGHGLNNETWGIFYGVIKGNPSSVSVWNELDEVLTREWNYADGGKIRVACACIDSGGHHTDDVYRYVRGKSKRGIFAVVGRGGLGRPSVGAVSHNNRLRVPLITLGVNTLKGEVYSRLQALPGDNGYCHFPADKRRGYGEGYFSGLLSESMVIRHRGGVSYAVWEKTDHRARNEPLDCRVYALGAFKILNPDMKRHTRNHGGSPQVKSVKKKPRPGILRRGIVM